MTKKTLIIFLFILFALPIPVAIAGFVLSLLWLLSSLVKAVTFIEIITSLFGVIIGSTYLVTYVFALKRTWKEKNLSIKTFLPIAHCLVAFLFLLSLKPISNYISETTVHFGFTKRDFAVVEELDTHGGFLGDGLYYLILDCSANKEKALEIVEHWNKLPLSENLNLIMYGGEKDGVAYGYELAEEAHIPKIENGYYIFIDRSTESVDSADDSEILKRNSFNFSIAIYDCDTDKMYYFEFDT